jgi:hypothetical protein
MLNIKLDDKEYDITTVSDEAKAQLGDLQFVDAKLQQQGQTAALQDASVANDNALKAVLPDAK